MRGLMVVVGVLGTAGVSVAATWWLFRSRLIANIERQKELRAARMQGRLDRGTDPPKLEPPKPWDKL